MSRSYRHSMIAGYSNGQSEKYFKRKSNRKFRNKVHRVCKSLEDFDDINFPLLREVSNVYDGSKDGKHWHTKFWLEPEAKFSLKTGWTYYHRTLFEQLKLYYQFFSK